MLQKISEKSQGIVSWVIVILIAIVFTAWGVNGFVSFGGRGQVAAKVDGTAISWREVENTYQRLLHEYAAEENANMANLNTQQLKMDARERLVQQTALLLEARKDGFYVGDQQIVQFLRFGIPEFQEKGEFSVDKFRAFLARSGYSDTMYQELVRNQLLLNQVHVGLMQSSFGLQPEIDLHVNLQYQKRDIGYTVIPIERFKEEAVVSEEEATTFYEQNKTLYEAPEKVKLAYLELSLPDLMKQITIEEKALEDFYHARQSNYTSPELVNVRHLMVAAAKDSDEEKSGEARAKAEDLLAQLKLGADFVELANQNSDDKETADKGGDLGWIGRGELPMALEKAVFALNETDALSAVIQTQYGYHIVQLIDRKPEVLEPFANVRKRVEREYRQEQADRMLADKADELANIAFEYPDSLQPAASALQLEIKTTPAFSKEGPEEGVASVSAVLQAAFSEDLLVEGRNSELIKVDDQRYVVVRVAEHAPPYQQSYQEVREDVKDYLKTRYAREKASDLASTLQKALEQNSTPFKVTKKYQLQWTKRDGLSRNDTDIAPAIIREAFAMPRPMPGAPNPVRAVPMVNGDYVVLSLAKVHHGEIPEDMDMMETIFKQQLSSMYGALESNLYRDVLIHRAKIELKEMP